MGALEELLSGRSSAPPSIPAPGGLAVWRDPLAVAPPPLRLEQAAPGRSFDPAALDPPPPPGWAPPAVPTAPPPAAEQPFSERYFAAIGGAPAAPPPPAVSVPEGAAPLDAGLARRPDESMDEHLTRLQDFNANAGAWGGIKELGRSVARGVYQFPDFASEAATGIGRQVGLVEPATAQDLEQRAAQREADAAALPEWMQESAYSKAEAHPYGSLAQAGESLVQSGGPLAAGTRIGAALGSVVPGLGTAAGAVAGALVGSVVGILGAAGAQAEASYEKIKTAKLQEGVDADAAEHAALTGGLASGAIEAGGEALGTYLFLRAGSLIPPSIKSEAVNAVLSRVGLADAGGTLIQSAASNKGALWGAAKDMAFKVLPAEIATEMAQQAGQQGVEYAYGAAPAPTWDDALQVVVPTLVMTGFMAGGTNAFGMHQRAAVNRALANPEDAPGNSVVDRVRAATAVEQAVRAEDPALADLWHRYSVAAIGDNKPLVVDHDDWFRELAQTGPTGPAGAQERMAGAEVLPAADASPTTRLRSLLRAADDWRTQSEVERVTQAEQAREQAARDQAQADLARANEENSGGAPGSGTAAAPLPLPPGFEATNQAGTLPLPGAAPPLATGADAGSATAPRAAPPAPNAIPWHDTPLLTEPVPGPAGESTRIVQRSQDGAWARETLIDPDGEPVRDQVLSFSDFAVGRAQQASAQHQALADQAASHQAAQPTVPFPTQLQQQLAAAQGERERWQRLAATAAPPPTAAAPVRAPAADLAAPPAPRPVAAPPAPLAVGSVFERRAPDGTGERVVIERVTPAPTAQHDDGIALRRVSFLDPAGTWQPASVERPRNMPAKEFRKRFPTLMEASAQPAAGQTGMPGASPTGTVEPPPGFAPHVSIDEAQAKALALAKEKAAKHRARMTIDPARDDLLAAVAKLGGIGRTEAQSQGLDPAAFDKRGFGIHRAFTATGDSFDGMAERLAQYGYPVLDDEGRYSPNVLLDQMDKSLRGARIITPQGAEFEVARLDAARAGREQAQRETAPVPPGVLRQTDGFALDVETPADLAARNQAVQAGAAEQRQADQRAAADAQRDGFVMTGSARPVDELEARGQRSLFGDEVPGARQWDDVDSRQDEPPAGRFDEDVPADAYADYALPLGGYEEVNDGDGSAVPGDLSVSEPRGRHGRRSGAVPGQLQLDLFEPADSERAAVPAPAAAPPAWGTQYNGAVQHRATQQYRSRLTHATTPADVAHATADLGQMAQESFVAVMTDDSGKILRLARLFTYTRDGSQVDAGLAAAVAHNTPGATRAWWVHNHPSGRAALSDADVRMERALDRLLRQTGIESRGILAVTPDGRYAFDAATAPDDPEMAARIPGHEGKRDGRLPVTERFLGAPSAEPVVDSSEAMSAAMGRLSGGQEGVLLLDVANRPLGFVPIDAQEMGSMLRTGREGAAARLYRAIDDTNASVLAAKLNVDFAVTGQRAAREVGVNLAGFANTNGLRLLDVIGDGLQQSLRGLGWVVPTKDAAVSWFSRDPIISPHALLPPTQRPAGLPLDQVQGVIDHFAAKLLGAARGQVQVTAVATQDEAFGPGSVERLGRVKGAYDPATRRIVLIAENLEDAADARTVLRHEAVGHFGLELLSPAERAEFLDLVDDAAERIGQVRRLRTAEQAKDPGADRARVLEEVFARVAEANRGAIGAAWDRVLTWLRARLRALGLIEGRPGLVEMRVFAADLARGLRAGRALQERPAGAAVRYAGQEPDARLAALVGQYAGVDGAPSAAELAEAVRQYRAVEARYAEVLRAHDEEGAALPAPNGERSNLNRAQWVLVRTDNFKQWFGDWEAGDGGTSASAGDGVGRGAAPGTLDRSEQSGTGAAGGRAGDTVSGMARPVAPAADARGVRDDARNAAGAAGLADANGEPRVFFHGTAGDFNAFALNHPDRKDAGWLGRGVYATSDAWLAETYANVKRGASGPNLMPIFMAVRHPLKATLADKKLGQRASQEDVDAETQRQRARGHDGVTLTFQDGTVEVVAFDPAAVKSATGNAGTFGASQDIRFSRTAQAPDADYLAAVARGDLETAQRLVDQAATAAGYTLPVYHGTDADTFTVFRTQRAVEQGKTRDPNAFVGAHLTADQATAERFADGLYGAQGGRVLRLRLKLDRPLQIGAGRPSAATMAALDAQYQQAKRDYESRPRPDNMAALEAALVAGDEAAIDAALRDEVGNALYAQMQARVMEMERLREANRPVTEQEIYTIAGLEYDAVAGKLTSLKGREGKRYASRIGKQLRTAIMAAGYDGVFYDNAMREETGWGGNRDTYIALHPAQIKSAEPVTRDDAGQVIPLSRRFDERQEDFRFHLVTPGPRRTGEPLSAAFLTARVANDALVTALRERFGLPVRAVQSEQEIPAAARAELARVRRDNPAAQPKALWVPGAAGERGEIILVADQLRDAREALALVFEEGVGHFGLTNLLGPQFGAFLDTVVAERNPEVAAWAAQYRLNMQDLGERRRAAEEFLAHTVRLGREADRGLIERLYQAIRAALRTLGVRLRLSDGDLREVLAAAHRYVLDGDGRAALQARGRVGGSGAARPTGARLAHGPVTDARLAALVGQYAGVDGAPSAAELAEAVRQYRAVEARYAEVLRAHDEEGAPLPAPNGGRSNLNREQWILTRTPNFQSWFEGSVVVDANGEPLMVYHGGRFDQDVHGVPDTQRKGKKGWQLPFGFHLAEDEREAAPYQPKTRGRLTRGFLAMRNPLGLIPTLTESGAREYHPLSQAQHDALPGALRKAYDARFGSAFESGRYGYREWLEGALEQLPSAAAAQAVRDMGYDGVEYQARANLNNGSYRPFRSWIVLDATRVKAADNLGTFADDNPDVRFLFAGQGARGADQHQLALAQTWLADGMTAEEVRRKTGWFRGVDGKWRFEINDAQAKLKPALKALQDGGRETETPIQEVSYARHDDGTWSLSLYPRGWNKVADVIDLNHVSESVLTDLLSPEMVRAMRQQEGTQDEPGLAELMGPDYTERRHLTDQSFSFPRFNALPLAEVLDHPALFAAYPGLRAVMVEVDPKLGRGGAFLATKEGQRVIQVAKYDQLPTILHELQHGIQEIEGFATGGNPAAIAQEYGQARARLHFLEKDPDYREATKKLDALWDQVFTQETMTEDDGMARERELLAQYPALAESRRLLAVLRRTSEDGYSAYKNLAGEVEARNVQARQSLGSIARENTPPGATQDVPDADLIVVFNGREMHNAPRPANAPGETASPVIAVTAIMSRDRSPLTGKPVFVVQDAQGTSLGRIMTAETAAEAIEVFNRRAQNPPAPTASEPSAPPRFEVTATRKAPPAPGEPRSNWKIYREPIQYGDAPDDFYYHITSHPMARRIIREGLVPGQAATVRGWYASYSRGKVFVTERNGVPFWKGKIADHLAAEYDNPPAVTVVRIPKSKAPTLQRDEEGSRDARADAWYGTTRFSLATTTPDLDQAADTWWTRRKQDLSDLAARALPTALGALTLRQLAEVANPTLPGTLRYDELRGQMETYRNDMMEEAGSFASEVFAPWVYGGKGRPLWQYLKPQVTAQARALFDLIHQATLANVDPSADAKPLAFVQALGPGWPEQKIEVSEASLADLEQRMRRWSKSAEDRNRVPYAMAAIAQIKQLLPKEKARQAARPALVATWNTLSRGQVYDHDGAGWATKDEAVRAQAEIDRKEQRPTLVKQREDKQWVVQAYGAQEIYREARDLYKDRDKRRFEALLARVEASGVLATGVSKAAEIARMRAEFESSVTRAGKVKVEPYFPLYRTGAYWVAGRLYVDQAQTPAEFYRDDAKTPFATEAKAWEAAKKRPEWLRYDLLPVQIEGEKGWFLREQGEPFYGRYATPAEAHRARDELHRDGYAGVRNGMVKETNQAVEGVSEGFIADAIDKLNAKGEGDAADVLHQLYLQQLQEMSQRIHFIHRKGISGYEDSALKAFGHTLFHLAHQIAKMQFEPRLAEQIRVIEENAKEAMDSERADAYLAELKLRHNWVMNPANAPWTNTTAALGFFWYLGVSPAAALVNLTQTPLIAYPTIAARFDDWGGAAKALRGAFDDVRRGLGKDQLAGYLKGQPHPALPANLTADERRAIDDWTLSGARDVTQAHNLAGIGDSDQWSNSPGVSRAMAILSSGFHLAEVINRDVTLLGAYRLARLKGQGHQEAVKTAEEISTLAHFDYSNANRARFMQGDVAKALLMFRSYSQGVLYLLGRSVWQATAGESAAVKREARQRLAGVMGMTFMAAGTAGLPLMGAAFATLNLVAAAFGDDDDPWDTETEFRSWMGRNLPRWLGATIDRGAVNAVSGLDLSGRVGLDGLLFRGPSRDLDGGKTYEYVVEQILGPLGGIGAAPFKAYDDLVEGHVHRALEAMSPKFVRDVLKTERYTREGVLTRRGDDLLGPGAALNAWELVWQGLGMSPDKVGAAWDTANMLKLYEGRIGQRRTELQTALALAMKEGDSEAQAHLMPQLRAWNQRWATDPQLQITPRSVRQSVRARDQRTARTQTGIVLRPGTEGLRERLGAP